MIIAAQTATRLIRAGKAIKVTLVYTDGKTYQAIDRLDLKDCRTDHYLIGHGDLR